MGHGHKDEGGCKAASFVIVGALTLVYCVAELIAAVWLHSLTLLSDGFHNLSDVVSLYIAHWAQKAAKKDATDKMSYGWARTEILGALTNGCFLLSLCIYVGLESIPRFIHPEEIEAGWWFIVIAGAGLGVNTFGTIMFAFTGVGHAHSHGGGGHGHDHGHGHAHKDKKKDKEHGHSHSHGEKKEKKEKKKDKHKHDHDHDHDVEEGIPMINKAKAPKHKKKMDVNTMAVFVHYLGDAISSLFVLGTGLLLHFFQDNSWAKYVDPASSLVIIVIILYSTIPLVKRCAMILLQGVPNDVELKVIRERLQKVEGVVNIHDFHVWQLVDGMVITSVHVTVDEGADFTALTSELKKILHQYGIHSSTIQPEFVAKEFASQAPYCEQNCVQECEEDWCCKKTAEKTQFDIIQNYTSSPPTTRASSAPQSKSIQYDHYQSAANGHGHSHGKEHGHDHGHGHGHGHSGSE